MCKFGDIMLFGKKSDKKGEKPKKDDLKDLAKSYSNKPVGFTKPSKFLFFRVKSKPIYAPGTTGAPGQQAQGAAQQSPAQAPPTIPIPGAPQQNANGSKYINKIISKKKDMDILLREADVRETPYDFVKKMVTYAIIVSAVMAVVVAFIIYELFSLTGKLAGVNAYAEAAVFGLVIAVAMYNVMLNNFITFPEKKLAKTAKLIERDILFAARDLVISMRSGMPLFNAMTAVSTGYAAASKEFAKVVDLIQLGMPIEQAMEEVSEKSKSKTFKRLMLQASVSIKAGVDVSGALQEVVSDVTQERVIELRRYGQKLNALAMFYMLFGVIFPSMGIAVAAILTTFISLFIYNAFRRHVMCNICDMHTYFNIAVTEMSEGKCIIIIFCISRVNGEGSSSPEISSFRYFLRGYFITDLLSFSFNGFGEFIRKLKLCKNGMHFSFVLSG